MSTSETRPAERSCGTEPAPPGQVEIIEPREVPLGGPRAMTVRRTLPARGRTMIGAWCFLDHYGPDDVAATGGMRVPPHPHTGLQTVSWLFTGEVEHQDSAGHHAVVRPGELNLMTAGRGINHSEYSTPETTVLHGAQLWTALPEASRFTDPGFESYAPAPVRGPRWELRVFLGSLAGSTSPVRTHSPLLGAELVLDGRDGEVTVELDLDPGHEHGVLLDDGQVELAVDARRCPLAGGQLAHLALGARRLAVTAPAGRRSVLLLLGGEPLRERITMFWNFVGRSHEEIERFRDAWQQQLGAADAPARPDGEHPAEPYGPVVPRTHGEAALPAPRLPGVRLKPRA